MSGRYTVEFERSAKKEFDRLDGPIRAHVLRKVAALEDDPRPPGASLAAMDQPGPAKGHRVALRSGRSISAWTINSRRKDDRGTLL